MLYATILASLLLETNNFNALHPLRKITISDIIWYHFTIEVDMR